MTFMMLNAIKFSQWILNFIIWNNRLMRLTEWVQNQMHYSIDIPWWILLCQIEQQQKNKIIIQLKCILFVLIFHFRWWHHWCQCQCVKRRFNWALDVDTIWTVRTPSSIANVQWLAYVNANHFMHNSMTPDVFKVCICVYAHSFYDKSHLDNLH